VAEQHGMQGTRGWSGGIVRRSWNTASGAVVAELDPAVTPHRLFERLAGRDGLLFLDSCPSTADRGAGAFAAGLGRYSFVAAEPFDSVRLDDHALAIECVAELRARLRAVPMVTIPGLPPFQGGFAGLLGYEFGLGVLGLPAAAGGRRTPAAVMHAYDVVAAFDHDASAGWIISQGVPATGPTRRAALALERLRRFVAAVEEGPRDTRRIGTRLPAEAAHPVSQRLDVASCRARARHEAIVARGIEYVRAGDVFQVNLAHRLAAAIDCDPVALARAAREVNPAPFSAVFDLGRGSSVVSSSPERFLQVVRGVVRMHPIKGTRRVTRSPEADLYAGDDLGASAKDRAENVMIVDLVRNDLSRVCRPESVRVEALCRLERYAYVQHLVSVVSGRLRPGLGPLDAVVAAVPAGSVTGAPKHRACEIITELEGFSRGPYCGSLGYLGFDGTADFNLLIRSFVLADGALTFSVGGGITAASDPAAEYDETLHKAEGMIRVLDRLARGGATLPAAATGAAT